LKRAKPIARKQLVQKFILSFGDVEMKIATQEFQDICTCIGQIVVPFAQLEASLDAVIAIVYQSGGGKTIEKELPSGLTRRTKFLGKCLKKLPKLADTKREGLEIIRTITKESDIRNHVVHGYFSHWNPEKNLATFTMLSTKRDKQMHHELVYHYTVQELLDSGGRILAVATRMAHFSRDILKLIDPQNPIGKSARKRSR
jgi:hypothetical protein